MGKEPKENNKETVVIGIVREIEDKRGSSRIGITTGDEIYAVKLNEEGKNLLYEVGNKVEATGVVSRTKDGLRRIDVTNYEVYEMDEDDLEEFGVDSDYFSDTNTNLWSKNREKASILYMVDHRENTREIYLNNEYSASELNFSA